MDNLLQGLQVRVIVCKLLFFVVEVTPSLVMSNNEEKKNETSTGVYVLLR